MAVDRNSATAMTLRGIIEELITNKAKSIERPTYGFPETQVLRGELKMLRRLYKEVSLVPPDEEAENESD